MIKTKVSNTAPGKGLPHSIPVGSTSRGQFSIPARFRAEHLLDRETISRFFSAWFPLPGCLDDIIEIRLKHGTKRNPSGNNCCYSQYYTRRELIDFTQADHSNPILTKLAFQAEQGWNIYLGVHPRHQRQKRRSGCNEDVPAVSEFILDADGWTEKTLSKNLARYQLPTPTLTVHSGRGLHLWWVLKAPINPRLGYMIQKYLVTKIFAGTRIAEERAYDLARLLRLPGTVNWKEGEKPLAVRLVAVNPKAVYDPFDVLGGRVPAWACDPKIIDYYKWRRPRGERLAAQGAGAETALPPTPKYHQYLTPADLAKIHKKKLQPLIPSLKKSQQEEAPTSYTVTEEVNEKQSDVYSDSFRLSSFNSRHSTLMLLARHVINTLGPDVQLDQIDGIHDRWFAANSNFINSSEASSRADFRSMIKSLRKVHDPSRREFSLCPVPHPLRHLIPSGRRYNNARRVADFLHAGSQKYGTGFFMARDHLARLLDLSTGMITKILKLLQRHKLVFVMQPADRSRRRATYWTTDKRMLQQFKEEQALRERQARAREVVNEAPNTEPVPASRTIDEIVNENPYEEPPTVFEIKKDGRGHL